MQNQLCRVCEEPAAGFHFGAFTCEGCKSFFGRTCNNQTVIQECKNNYQCIVDKKNRTACKACRLRKCLMVGMSKSGSRYGRRSNWFKIHCLMQQSMQHTQQRSQHAMAAAAMAAASSNGPASPPTSMSLSPTSPPSRPWSIPKNESKEMKDDRAESPDLESPTMVPRALTSTTSLAPSFSSVPLTSLLQPLSPIAVKPSEPPISPPVHPAAPIPSFYGFPGFPLMSAPGYPGIPLHKQSLLSPLLASPHFWQAAVRHPLLSAASSLRPELDLMAEHKALMERFASSMSAAAAMASREASISVSVSPPTSRPRSKTPEPPQNIPMDLSNKRSERGSSSSSGINDDSDDDDLKSDLNRNVVMTKKRRLEPEVELSSSR